jgi:hypothetical protein
MADYLIDRSKAFRLNNILAVLGHAFNVRNKPGWIHLVP